MSSGTSRILDSLRILPPLYLPASSCHQGPVTSTCPVNGPSFSSSTNCHQATKRQEKDIPPYGNIGFLIKDCFLFFSFFFVFFFVFFFFAISRAASTAYGGSQARGLTGAVAVSLCQSHSNSGSELCLRPTPQLTATPDR